jgi:16S rRNA (cytosine1407-C5)-methyltransferase
LLKTKPGFIQSMAEHYGWSYSAIPFCPTGFRIESNPGAPISSVLEHKLGMFYIQEAASMLPVELFHFNLSPSEITLDLAASPGGKTTHLIDRSHDTGLVIANDSSQGRIQALKIVLQHWGAVSAAVTRFPGENFGRWFPNTFDRALIDAPCSMQGLRTADSHSSRPVTEKESKNLSRRQISLLISALQAVRVGAEVVYSTCTLVPEEDEGVVETVLKKLGNAVNLINAQEILPQPAPGVQKDENGEYENSMTNTIRFWPHRYHTAGFFTCLFRKNVELNGKGGFF